MRRSVVSHWRMLETRKCFWHMLDYECCEGEWKPRELVNWELLIPMEDGSQKSIHIQLKPP